MFLIPLMALYLLFQSFLCNVACQALLLRLQIFSFLFYLFYFIDFSNFYFLIAFGILSPFFSLFHTLLPATALNTSLPSKDFLLGPIFFFFFLNRVLPYFRSALIDLVIDSIIGPNSSLPCNGITYPYICFITLLCSPSAGGILFPTPCDLLWQWKMGRCHRSKGLTYIFQGLAWLLYSGSAMRRACPDFLLPC